MKREKSIPDIWGIRQRTNELVSRCQTGRYQQWHDSIIEESNSLLKSGETGRAETAARIPAEEAVTLAWAWLFTKREEYSIAALERLLVVASRTGAWAGEDHSAMYPEVRADLILSETIKASATALSMLDSGLDSKQRWFLTQACCVLPGQIIYGDSQKGAWWGNALNSNWTSVLNSALGFAGIVGLDQPGADTKPWIDLARKSILDMLDLASEDAGGVEGPSYWIYCFGSAQDFAVADICLGNTDLLSHAFWAKAAEYLAYFVLPDFSGWINYGDTPYDSVTGSHVFHCIANYNDDSTARSNAWKFAEEMLAHHPTVIWKNLLYDPDTAPEHQDRSAPVLPRSAFFRSVHLASFRSGWESDDTLLFVRGGSNAWSHMHLDLGSFVIHSHGERLAVDPGPAPYSLHYWHSIVDEASTRWHNCMVIDGANQRVGAQYAMSNRIEDAGDCYARMFGYTSGESIDLLSVDCTAAYGDFLERYVRTFAFLAPGLIAVFDDCRTKPGRFQRNFEWMLHSECAMVSEGDTIVARGQRAELRIHSLVPSDGEFKFIEGKTLPKLPDHPLYCVSMRPYWFHKWNVNPAKSKYPHWHPKGDKIPLYGNDYRFLKVLQIVPRSGIAAEYEVKVVESDRGFAAEMTSENERCLVGFDPDGKGLEIGGLKTDAAAVAYREPIGSTGTVRSGIEWAFSDGTFIGSNGNDIFHGQNRSDRSGKF
ncbi:MAG: hypothetical protein HN368_19915 [Spirochaetales bacterium]|jgi:hypothetical protein|nr:hypothetical protein [Spirochaetales bacterium]